MAKLIIPIKDEEQLNHIFKAESQLSKAGITFDRSEDFDPVTDLVSHRIWELDWSLKGAQIKEKGGDIDECSISEASVQVRAD